MRGIRFFCLLGLLLWIAMEGSAWAAGESNARSLGMAGAYTGVARNVEAADWNPANLGLSGDRSVVVGLPSMGFEFGNNAFSMDVYERYNGKYLSEQDKADILDLIRDGWRFDASFRFDVFGVSIGRVALTHWAEFASDFVLTQAPFEMLLRGTEVGKTITLDDLEGEVRVWDVTALSYAYSIPRDTAAVHSVSRDTVAVHSVSGDTVAVHSVSGDTAAVHSVPLSPSRSGRFRITELSVGASVKYIVGLAYGKLETSEGRLVFDEYAVHGNGAVQIETAGVTWNLGEDEEGEDPDFRTGKIGGGLALDLGAAAVLDSTITVSVGLMNVIGGITWDTQCERAVFSFQADSLNVVSVAEDTTDGDSLYVSSDTSYSIGSFRSNVPAVLNVGVAYRLNVEENGLFGLHPSPWLVKDVVVAMDWRQGFSKGLGVSTTPRIALGIENKVLKGCIPLRYGLAFGGSEGIVQTVGWGLYLGPFRWDTAWKNRGHWPFVSSKGVSWATRFQLAF